MTVPKLETHVVAIHNELELLLKLLGGTAEERLRALEILKGITTPAVTRVVETQLQAVQQSLKAARTSVEVLQKNSKELSNIVVR